MKHTKLILATILILLLVCTFVACDELNIPVVPGPQGSQGEQGEQGPVGADGTSLLTGKGAPAEDLGKIGDSYIDLDTFDYYVKSATEWSLEGNIKGSDAVANPDHNGTEGLAFYPLNDTECAVAVGNAKYLEEIVIPETYKGYTVTTIIDAYTRDKMSEEDFWAALEMNALDGVSFVNCTKLKKIILPNTITYIGNGAFALCTNLEEITIPDSVKFIGENAFCGNEKLSKLTIGKGVKEIANYAFSEALSQEAEVYYTGTLEDWCGITFGEWGSNPCGVENFYIDGKRIEGELVIPNSITKIKARSFEYANITSLVVPDSVNEIGEKAFYCCESLKTIKLGKGLNVIGEYAFSNCSSLTGDLVIPDSVTTIKERAFNNCSRLLTVTLGENLESLGDYAFAGCWYLVEVFNKSSIHLEVGVYHSSCATDNALAVYDGGHYSNLEIDENGYVVYMDYANREKILVGYIGEISAETIKYMVIPEGVTRIKQEALDFYHNGSGIKAIVIPTSVKEIELFGINVDETIYYMGTEEQWKAITIDDFAFAGGEERLTIVYNYVPA